MSEGIVTKPGRSGAMTMNNDVFYVDMLSLKSVYERYGEIPAYARYLYHRRADGLWHAEWIF